MKYSFKRILAVVLSVALLFSCLVFPAVAKGEKIGIIYGLDTNLRVRTGPGTSNSQLSHEGVNISVYSGDQVTILEEVPCNDDSAEEYPTWYKITFKLNKTDLEGFVPTEFVRVKEQIGEITPDFEETIASFPEDYKESLRELHKFYPEWQFVPMHINMDWSYVIEQEAQPSVNYVSVTAPESHRSTEAGNYDWTTDTWIKYDGKYNASKELIAYYMDPRNFLDEKYIFQFESLSYNPDLHTLEGLEQMTSKIEFMNGKTIKNADKKKISYAQAYLDAAKKTNVSPYHLLARTRQEVGVKGSGSVSGKVEGFEGIYNFYNIGATSTLQDGLEWASRSGSYGRPWNSKYKSIVGGAEFIGTGYINKGQNTLYFEKFDVVGDDLFTHQYMQTISAPYSEAATIYNTYQEMESLNSAFCFIIPVYNNMPETKCEKPTRTGSPNNWLKSLEVEGYTITPSFECNGSTEYSLIVEKDVKSVEVKAVAVSDQANITDGANRTVKLSKGSNRVLIKVAAGNGDIKTYELIIVRGEASELPPVEEEEQQPPEDLGSYKITFPNSNGRISGIALGTTLEDIKKGLGLEGKATAAFYKADGTVIEDLKTVAATGIKVKITTATTDVFTLVLYGDANGDGLVDAVDLLMLRRSILKTYDLKNVYYSAADCNRDGEVDAVDLLMVRRQILKTYTIEQ